MQSKNGIDLIFFRAQYTGMKTVAEILDALGRENVAQRLSVAKRRVDRAANEAQLPALWYFALSDMHGADLPRHLFTSKGMNVSPCRPVG